jgi:hypothetical protein
MRQEGCVMSRVTMVALLALIGALPAAAQPAPDSRDQSIAAGAQWGLPYSGRGEPPGVEGSWRRWFSPRIGVGADFRWLSRNTSSGFGSATGEDAERVVVQSAPGRDDRRISSYGLCVCVLGRGSVGRLSLIVGAGPGLSTDRTAYTRRINDRHEAGTSTLTSIGVHTLAEIDVRATSRLSVFAGLRIDLRDLRSPESASGYPALGLRFAF